MRKIFLLFCLFMSVLSCYSQNRNDLYKQIVTKLVYPVEMQADDYFVYSDDSIEFHIRTIGDNDDRILMLAVGVINKTNNKIYIDWDNTHLCGSKVVFGDDRRLFIDNKKEAELLYGGEETPMRELLPRKNITDYSVIPLYSSSEKDEFLANLIVPIRFLEDVKDYKFTISFSKYSETEIDSLFNIQKEYYQLSKKVRKKMTKDEVVAIMGEPLKTDHIIPLKSDNAIISGLYYPFVFIRFGYNEKVDKVILKKSY